MSFIYYYILGMFIHHGFDNLFVSNFFIPLDYKWDKIMNILETIH